MTYLKAAGITALLVAGVIYVQMILGGEMLIDRTTNFHTGLGHFIQLPALIAMIVFWRVKPPSKFLRWGGILLFLLTVIQASALGILIDPTPDTNRVILLAHGLNAAILFALATALSVVAVRELPRIQPTK